MLYGEMDWCDTGNVRCGPAPDLDHCCMLSEVAAEQPCDHAAILLRSG